MHLINLGVTKRNIGSGLETWIEWGLSGPNDVLQSRITFLCSLDNGVLFPCKYGIRLY